MKEILVLTLMSVSTAFTPAPDSIKELNAEGVRYYPQTWKAYWITHPDVAQTEHGVVWFRRSFELDEKPKSFIVHVSGDNKYELYVNGVFVCMGPARADLQHWRFETLNIAPLLREGTNVIAAQVVNWGVDRMKAQWSARTALFLAGNGANNELIRTDDDGWKVYTSEAFREKPVRWMYAIDTAGGWYCANPMDIIDGRLYPWGWQDVDFDDSKWLGAKWLEHPASRGTPGHSDWLFVPRTIKLLEHTIEPLGVVIRTDNIDVPVETFKNRKPLTIPAGKTVSILLDQKALTIGYPEISLSGGRGAKVTISYAESLYDKDRNKTNRNIIEGRQFIGYGDAIIPDGAADRVYRPTWLRPFRFLKIDVETKDEPLTINDFYNIRTTYPVREVAKFHCDDPVLQDIWDICWRTVHLCSQDLLMSDAYYETMQYTFDARNHALTLYYMSGDTSLWREAIRHFDDSRIPDGLALASYPNNWHWIIPYYSLSCADMLYDYVMVTGDKELPRQMAPGVRIMFGWFDDRINDKGILGRLEWAGAATVNENSAYITLAYAYTLRNVADVWDYMGWHDEAARYRARSAQLAKNVFDLCFDAGKKRMAETPNKRRFRDMTTVVAVLTDSIPKDMQKECIEGITNLDFSRQIYLMDAYKKAGLGSRFMDLLGLWRRALDEGLTTCPEGGGKNPRSDCHPWSTNPPVHYFRTICGIRPAEPGFTKVEVAPELGPLNEVEASLLTPKGAIEVSFRRKGESGIEGSVTLPAGVTGSFRWNGKDMDLKSGKQTIDIDR